MITRRGFIQTILGFAGAITAISTDQNQTIHNNRAEYASIEELDKIYGNMMEGASDAWYQGENVDWDATQEFIDRSRTLPSYKLKEYYKHFDFRNRKHGS